MFQHSSLHCFAGAHMTGLGFEPPSWPERCASPAGLWVRVDQRVLLFPTFGLRNTLRLSQPQTFDPPSLDHGAGFSKVLLSSCVARSERFCHLPCRPLMRPGLRTSLRKPGPGLFGCSFPVCFSTSALANTGSPSQSGVPGFWISKPAGGRHALLQSAAACVPAAADAPPPAAPANDPVRRAERAARLVGQGELSAASSVFGPLAFTPASLAELRDPDQPYEPIDPAILDFFLAPLVALTVSVALGNLRRAKKGAAVGPTGYTSEF